MNEEFTPLPERYGRKTMDECLSTPKGNDDQYHGRKPIVTGFTFQGLTEQEARERLRQEGYNEIPSEKRQGILALFFKVLREPMLLMLLIAGTIYLFLGDAREALMLLTFIAVVIGITFLQERKTEKAVEALRNLSSPRALVIRDGKEMRISGREVVRGDLVVVREGDRVPADAMVLSCEHLSVDESLLTGESQAVRKSEGKENHLAVARPGGDDLPFVYSGTMVVQGRGITRVAATGAHTQMGKIGKSLAAIREEDTLLKKETNKIIRVVVAIGAFLCIIVVLLIGLSRGNWLEGFLAGLTLSMAMLPEEFSVVLIVFLTLGAWRISKRNVLARHMPAIETLGAATVLCVDKTGTLTKNQMTLKELSSNGMYEEITSKDGQALPEQFHELIEYGMLASQTEPFDPLEKELLRLGSILLSQTEHIHKDWELVKEYPLSKELLALSHVWKSPDGEQYVIAVKGSPEAITDLCHSTPQQIGEIERQVEAMSRKGLRILGVAKAIFKKVHLPTTQHVFAFEFVGLLGFADPLRSSVPEAVNDAQRAGMRIIMVSGDYPGTAQAIAREAGLRSPEYFLTGPELETMDEAALREKVKTVNIFARIMPEQKLALVEALKANGEIVAMTGDGVNDAPALKSAHIGIAMGARGTDVAREASDLVLLDDDFSSIVSAVRLGRRIFDNLKKAMGYIVAVHVPIAGMSLLPVALHLPLALLPAHIAFLELIIDPACSVVFEAEPEERDVMERPPRNLKKPLLSRMTVGVSLLQGLSVLAVVFAMFQIALMMGKGEADARTLAFSTLVFANIFLIITNLSSTQGLVRTLRTGNKTLHWIAAGTLLALLIVLYTPPLRNLFHFSVFHVSDLIVTFIAGIASLLWFEGFKIIRRIFVSSRV
ncbi:MAG: cation-translocating P-type ATPase [Patescibacteria group bacterium]